MENEAEYTGPLSKSKPRKRTSNMWSFFSIIDDDGKISQCDVCGRKFSFKSSVTNLRKHLERKHPDLDSQIDNKGIKKRRRTSSEVKVDKDLEDGIVITVNENGEISSSSLQWNAEEGGAEEVVESAPKLPHASSASAFFHTYTATSGNDNHRQPSVSMPVSEASKVFCVEKPAKGKQDDLSLFFDSILETTRKLPRKLQNKIKVNILSMVSEVEDEYEHGRPTERVSVKARSSREIDTQTTDVELELE